MPSHYNNYAGELMILDAFKLAGKVAIVTGCDTGLGQGDNVRSGGGRMRYRRREP